VPEASSLGAFAVPSTSDVMGAPTPTHEQIAAKLFALPPHERLAHARKGQLKDRGRLTAAEEARIDTWADTMRVGTLALAMQLGVDPVSLQKRVCVRLHREPVRPRQDRRAGTCKRRAPRPPTMSSLVRPRATSAPPSVATSTSRRPCAASSSPLGRPG
jgi:hypothetical protein